MVKGYDPTSLDVSALLLNHIIELFNSDPTLPPLSAETYVRHWLKTSKYTSGIYSKFKHMEARP
jgi:hypothetical protein